MAAISDDQHFPDHWDSEAIIVVTCTTISIYNALELSLLIFATFKDRYGLYFWSLTIATIGMYLNVHYALSAFLVLETDQK